jgi:hypothetical protein
MDEKEKPDSYKVGFGKPPKATQFKKGTSGNPKGRPKQLPGVEHLVMKESRALIPINENGRRRRIPKQEVVIRQLLNRAMAGSDRATRIYLGLCQQIAEKATLSGEPLTTDPEYEMYKQLHARLENATDQELDDILETYVERRKKHGERKSKESDTE